MNESRGRQPATIEQMRAVVAGKAMKQTTDQIAAEAANGIAREVIHKTGANLFDGDNIEAIATKYIKAAIEKARHRWDEEEAAGIGEQRRANADMKEAEEMSRYFWGGFFAAQLTILWLLVWPIPSWRKEVWRVRQWYLDEFPVKRAAMKEGK